MSRLAIDGGQPVRGTMLPYGRQSIDESDIHAVTEVLRSDWLTTGPKVAEFESAFAAAVGAKHAIAVSSGTAALHCASYAVGLEPGAEAIVPAMTFAASANCVRYQGASVVFADVRADTLNLDVGEIDRRASNNTRCIMTVDYTGHPSDLEQINASAARLGIPVIEDAAHALGASYHGRPIGSQASITVFSLHPVKHITTGEGGLLTTEDDALAARARVFRNHGITSTPQDRELTGSWFYEMAELGFNYRITDFQCALGLSQLSKLGRWVQRRREIAARYGAAFHELDELQLPTVLPGADPSWHLYVIRLNLSRLRAGRAEIFRALRAENIGVNVHYVPVPWHPYYRRLGCKPGNWPVAEDSYERMLSLPIFSSMSNSDVDDVIEATQKVIQHFRA